MASEWAVGHELRAGEVMATIQKPYRAGHLQRYDQRERCRVGAKWKPVYDELCRRMFGREPGALDFAWEGDTLIVRPFDHPGPRSEGWTEDRTPQEAMEALGIAALVKAQRTRPKGTPAPANGPRGPANTSHGSCTPPNATTRSGGSSTPCTVPRHPLTPAPNGPTRSEHASPSSRRSLRSG